MPQGQPTDSARAAFGRMNDHSFGHRPIRNTGANARKNVAARKKQEALEGVQAADEQRRLREQFYERQQQRAA